MSDPLDNGLNYADAAALVSLQNRAQYSGATDNLGWLGIISDDLNAEAQAKGKSLDGFFAQFTQPIQYDSQNRPITKQLPNTWDEFIRAFRRDYLGEDPPLPPETTANSTFSDAALAYGQLSGIFETTTDDGDSVQQIINSAVFNGTMAQPNLGEQFKKAFAEFMSNYPYQTGGTVGTSITFFQKFNKFLTLTATILHNGQVKKPDANYLPISTVGQTITNSITSFEDIFNQYPPPPYNFYFPSGNFEVRVPSFADRFVQFYNSFVAENGYFATGRAFQDWSKELVGNFYNGTQGTFPADVGSTGYVGFQRVTADIVATKTDRTLFATQLASLATQNNITNVANTWAAGFNTISFNFQFSSADQNNTDEKIVSNDSRMVLQPPGIPGITTYQLTIPPDIVTATSVNHNALKDFLTNALSKFTFESGSPIVGDRSINVHAGGGSPQEVIIVDTFTIKGITEVNTSVTTDSTVRLLVIDRILRLIGSMIDTMQQIAAAQADYLSFLTQWQQAYTDLISEIKTFTRSDGSVFGQTNNGTSDAAKAEDQLFATKRGDANTFNITQRERLSNLRGVVSDTAKRIQSNLNQSQDAATQQGQFATSLLQELSTILGAIYR